MKRYTEGAGNWCMKAATDGEWVRYEEVARLLSQLRVAEDKEALMYGAIELLDAFVRSNSHGDDLKHYMDVVHKEVKGLIDSGFAKFHRTNRQEQEQRYRERTLAALGKEGE